MPTSLEQGVAAALVAAATEVGLNRVGEVQRKARDTAEALVHLKGRDLLLERLDLVLLDHGAGGVAFGLDLLAEIAATLGNLTLDGVRVLERGVSEVADRVIGLSSDGSLLVVHATDLALEFVEAVGVAKVCLGHGITSSVTAESPAAVAHEREDDEREDPETTVHTVAPSATAIDHGADICCCHRTFHNDILSLERRNPVTCATGYLGSDYIT